MRALVMDFNGDTNVNNIGDQFMFGPSLMVAPVYQYKARSREVYFPAGTGWYDLLSGKFIPGGQTLAVDAPFEKLPLFVREGAILPVGPEISYAAEKPGAPITLFVYTGKNGTFSLYEDEGTNYNYEKGNYSTIPFHYEDASGTLTIGERKGSFTGMPETRTFNVVWISKDKPAVFTPDALPHMTTVYTGKQIILTNKK